MLHPAVMARAIAILFLAFCAAACAHLSVIHLSKAPWVPGTQTTLSTRHWTFVFRGDYQDGRLVLQGTALPREGEIPSWATWAQDLWIQVYLSDASGRVLASDLRLYLPLDIRKGVPLEFHLAPKSVGAEGPLSVSFGYRMELTTAPGVRPEAEPQVFFASQGALFQ
ncbi:MAG: hypothetical protein WHT64_08120 [Desulfomicrobiaceae bacterium]